MKQVVEHGSTNAVLGQGFEFQRPIWVETVNGADEANGVRAYQVVEFNLRATTCEQQPCKLRAKKPPLRHMRKDQFFAIGFGHCWRTSSWSKTAAASVDSAVEARSRRVRRCTRIDDGLLRAILGRVLAGLDLTDDLNVCAFGEARGVFGGTLRFFQVRLVASESTVSD